MSRSAGHRPSGARQLTRVISDGTGRSDGEVVVLATAAATIAVSVAAWRVIAWAVDAVTDVDLWPDLPGRGHG
ncbi:hypothetical protein [Nocardioides sp.]|uniref:hypothetical protein n=1 Tax=Nocardioides sp. TaxID=35761 RepID=UPI002ED1F040